MCEEMTSEKILDEETDANWDFGNAPTPPPSGDSVHFTLSVMFILA